MHTYVYIYMYIYTYMRRSSSASSAIYRERGPFAFFPSAVFSADAKLDFPVAGAAVVDVALIRSPRNATALISER
jgi:hypothetical protein